MKKLLFIVLIFLGIQANAQIAGYMGKRFSLGYSVYGSPTFLNPSYYSGPDYEVGINLLHCINADYVIKPRTALTLSGQFGKTGLSYDTDYSNAGVSYDYLPKSKRVIPLRMTNISLGFKFFGRGQIAPLGKYKKLDFVLIMGSVEPEKDGFRVSVTDQKYNFSREFKYKSFAIGYTFGRQRIFFDKLILDTGFRFGFTPLPILELLGEGLFDGGSSYSSNSIDSQFQSDAKSRFLFAQLFNFHLGLGFLAF
ncbi:MAG: hypothetical protein M3R27_09695 [Bacteroidota bacterium]|nr:hypothetical protein [Bacteroidota bacterium]